MGKNIVIQGCNQRKLKRALLLDKFIRICFPAGSTANVIPTSFNSILIVQSHLIGDLIMAVPILKTLRNNFPNARIILLANEFANDLLKGESFIDEIFTVKFPWSTYDYSWKNIINVLKTILKLRKRKIDLAIDAQIDMRNAILMFLIGAKRRLGYAITGGSSFLTDIPEFPENISNLLEARLSVLKYLGIDRIDQSTTLSLNKSGLDYIDSFLKKNFIDHKKLIGIHPGASKKEKLWPVEYFSEVIRYLLNKGLQVVLIEGPDDKIIVEKIQNQLNQTLPCFKSSLQNVLAFISLCQLLICLDSAAIHLAGATNTPTIAIYGPRWPVLTKPFASNIEILWNANLECRPCEYGKCKYDNNVCMTSIASEQVIDKIGHFLRERIL